MLSILIPTYNFDIQLLVQKLHQQALVAGIPFEILIVEDASSPSFVELNKGLKQLKQVDYEVLDNNIGRSKIRNYLAQKAIYDYLLFMDCDSMPISDSYLSLYIAALQPNRLLYGGRCYQSKPPSDSNFYFHWYYGKNREESRAETRQKSPHQSFMTNNFLIPKAVFQQIKFDETLTQYGHEDTLFGLELKKINIPILHLNNPLEHIGLETASVFIKKSEQALENLALLQAKFNLQNDVKLLRYYFFFQQKRLTFIIKTIYQLSKNLLKINLHSRCPKLVLFDFYKLGYLTVLLSQKKQ